MRSTLSEKASHLDIGDFSSERKVCSTLIKTPKSHIYIILDIKGKRHYDEIIQIIVLYLSYKEKVLKVFIIFFIRFAHCIGILKMFILYYIKEQIVELGGCPVNV